MSNYGDVPRDSEATRALTELDDKLVEVGEESGRQSAHNRMDRVERKTSRAAQAAVAISLLVALLSLLLAGWNTISIAHNEASNAVTKEGLESLKAANERLKDRGLPEIPLPREGEPIDADALAAAAAAILKEDIADDPRFRGPQGPPGDSCDSNQIGCRGPAGPSGENGPEGPAGPSGVEGPPGEDATITDEELAAAVAAYCTGTSNPCQGDQGPQGDPGEPGPQGPAGPPPAVFTFTIPGDGLLVPDRNYVCNPSPVGSSNFVCEQV